MLPRDRFIKFLVRNVFTMVLLSGLACASNYPDAPYHDKPCMRHKNTVNTLRPICIPTANEDFTPESKDNCAKLKEDCPEFNEWECVWYDYRNPNLSEPLQFPTCRVKYYARRYTWGEIYYTNQYGTGPNVANDIVELHRFIKKGKAFPNIQEDWPKNVLDPMGERGLSWKESKPLLGNFSAYYKPAPELLCQNMADSNDNCRINTVNFNNDNFRHGIGGILMPEYSEKENKSNARVVFEVKGMCDYIMLTDKKTPACRGLYVRSSTYDYKKFESGDDGHKVRRRTSQQWMEVQIWQKTLADPKTKKQPEFGLRYAPLHYDPPVDLS